jgi:hypothetical protein
VDSRARAGKIYGLTMAKWARAATLAACGLLVAGVLVAVGLAWRLSRGPIVLDALTPRLEAAMAAPDGSARVAIGSTAIEWDPVDRDVDLRVHDLRVLGAGGAPVATLPQVAVGLAPGALLLGRVRARTMQAIRPQIQLVRQPDGRIAIGLGGEPAPEATRLVGGSLVRGAADARAGSTGPRSIGVRDGDVTIDDRATGTTWHATHVSLAAHREAAAVIVDRLSFEVDPARVVATGRVAGGATDLQISLSSLPTALLERWWPATVAPAAHSWVAANVSRGGIRATHLSLTGRVAGDHEPAFTIDAITGRFQFAGINVRWLEGMPPVTGVGGTGTFSRDAWELRVARGEVEGLDVVRALIRPQRDHAGLSVDTTGRGPLSKVLTLLESPPLKSGGGIPFRPGDISGGVTARVRVDVPFEGGITNVRANGDLRSVSMRRVFRGRNASARHMRVDLDGRRLEVRGQVTVGRAALELRWRETIAGTGRGRRVIDLKGRLDDAGRKALGMDLAPWLDGPVQVQARLEPKGQDVTPMALHVDLVPASLDIPILNMVKAPGDPGSLQANLVVANSQVRAADAFDLEANGSSLNARATFGPDETWLTAEGKASIAPRVPGGTTPTFSFLMRPAGVGNQLTATSDDAGAVLRAIDSYADARGGRVQLTTEIRPSVPGVPMSGTLRIDKFTLTRSPMIAKVAALTSISGVVDALAAGGLPVAQLGGTFTHRSGVVTLSDCLATGPAMALTLRGTIDRNHDDLALDGTLVPNYAGLAKLAASAAMVGPTLSSAPGEGVEAADFTVSGSLEDPYVTARPASASTTRALRGLLRPTGFRWSSKPTESVESNPKTKGRSRRDQDEEPLARSRTKGRSRQQQDLEPQKTRPRARRRSPAAPSEPGTGIE